MHTILTNGQIIYRQDYSCIIQPQNGKGGIYIGNLQAAQNLKTLKKLGIRAILTAAKGIDLTHSKSQIPFYLQVPGQDRDSFDLTKYFLQSINFIRDSLQTTSIMVHCLAGVSRSVCLVLAYLIKHHGVTYQDAYTLVKSKRSIIHPNDGFINQLKKFQTQTKTNDTTPPKYGIIQSRVQRPCSSPSKKRYEYSYLSKQCEITSKNDPNTNQYQRNRSTTCSYYLSPTKKPLIDIDNYTQTYNSPQKPLLSHQFFNKTYQSKPKQFLNNSQQKPNRCNQIIKQFKQQNYLPSNTIQLNKSSKYQFFNQISQFNTKYTQRYITPDQKKINTSIEPQKQSIQTNTIKLSNTNIQTQRLFGNYDRLRHTSTTQLCEQLDNKIAAIRQKYSQYTKTQFPKHQKPKQSQSKSAHYCNENQLTNPLLPLRKKHPQYQNISSKISLGQYGIIKKIIPMDRSTVGLGNKKFNLVRQTYC